MTGQDLVRELGKLREAMTWAEQHLTHQDEANAALHCNPRVFYSPLTSAVHEANAGLDRILTDLATPPLTATPTPTPTPTPMPTSAPQERTPASAAAPPTPAPSPTDAEPGHRWALTGRMAGGTFVGTTAGGIRHQAPPVPNLRLGECVRCGAPRGTPDRCVWPMYREGQCPRWAAGRAHQAPPRAGETETVLSDRPEDRAALVRAGFGDDAWRNAEAFGMVSGGNRPAACPQADPMDCCIHALTRRLCTIALDAAGVTEGSPF